MKSITVLHLSDMQFGAHHRFGVKIGPEGNNPYDTLRERLIADLQGLLKDHKLAPDLLIITGDLTETGRKSEFDGVLDLIKGLENELRLGRDRTIVIPGNHDVNRDGCEAYFKECSANDKTPAPPYWQKWKQYVRFFKELYRGLPERAFTKTKPWTLFAIESLKVVVAGLNSTLAESHQDTDHYGWAGEPQYQWFANSLHFYEDNCWLRLGAIHHNVVGEAEGDDENLKDARRLKSILGPHVNCVLHGHTHETDMSFWIDRNVPTLATGSAAVRREARPDEVPNQYQVIQFWSDHIVRYSRAYDPRSTNWIPDARIREGNVAGRQKAHVNFHAAHLNVLEDIHTFQIRYGTQQDLDQINNVALSYLRAEDMLPRDQVTSWFSVNTRFCRIIECVDTTQSRCTLGICGYYAILPINSVTYEGLKGCHVTDFDVTSGDILNFDSELLSKLYILDIAVNVQPELLGLISNVIMRDMIWYVDILLSQNENIREVGTIVATQTGLNLAAKIGFECDSDSKIHSRGWTFHHITRDKFQMMKEKGKISVICRRNQFKELYDVS